MNQTSVEGGKKNKEFHIFLDSYFVSPLSYTGSKITTSFIPLFLSINSGSVRSPHNENILAQISRFLCLIPERFHRRVLPQQDEARRGSRRSTEPEKNHLRFAQKTYFRY